MAVGQHACLNLVLTLGKVSMRLVTIRLDLNYHTLSLYMSVVFIKKKFCWLGVKKGEKITA